MLDRPGNLEPMLFAGVLVGVLVIAAALMRRRTVVMRVPARLDSIRPVTALVSNLAERADLSEKSIFDCRLALDEACVNIIRHAYAEQPEGEIEIAVEVGKGECTISLTDFGEPYDPADIPQPQKGTSIDDMEPGGLGLYLMRTVMDEVRYVPGRHSNCLVLVKRE